MEQNKVKVTKVNLKQIIELHITSVEQQIQGQKQRMEGGEEKKNKNKCPLMSKIKQVY